MKPTGLQKLAIEVPFKSGLTEKIHPDVSEPSGMYTLENVELDKLGVYRRRRGYSVMSNAIINSLSTSGTPRKVGSREDEVFKITEDHLTFGSGGGTGAAGATLWAYSPEADAWLDKARVSSVTLDRFVGIVSGQPNISATDTGFCFFNSKEFVVLTYWQSEFAGANKGVYVGAYDASSRTCVLEPTQVDGATLGAAVLQVISIGQYCVILYRNDVGVGDLCARVYDASNNGLSAQINIFTASANGAGSTGSPGFCGTTDGTSLFLAYSTGTGLNVEKFTVTGSTIVSSGGPSQAAGTVNGGVFASISGGTVHTNWFHTGVGVKYASFTTAPLVVAAAITVSSSLPNASRVYNAALNANEAVIFWDTNGTTTTEATVHWRWIKLAASAPAVRTNEHTQPGVQIAAGPFIHNSRAYVPLVGVTVLQPSWEPGPTLVVGLSNFGYCLAEVNSSTAEEELGVGNPYLTFLPVGIWSRDVSQYTRPGLGAFGGGSDRYISTVRQARQADAFTQDFILDRGFSVAIAHNSSVWMIDIMRFKFDDRKRWQHAEGGGGTLLACALPYQYDGMNAHECGYVFRPAVLEITEGGAGSGSFQAGQTVLYKAVYEWEDTRGGRWFSDTSITGFKDIVGGGLGVALSIKVRLPSISAKPRGGHGFANRIKVNLYRAMQDAPEDFRLADTQTFMIWDGAGAALINYMVMTDSGVSDLLSNERAYIFGEEVENACAPPCRSIVMHRDRFFAIDTENNKLWYTKPFNRDRGVEWSKYQTLALPSKGLALASIEGSLLVFCERQILLLEGQGPAVTGAPADAYSRFAILTQDQGTPEVNAVWRTPGGCLFRTSQGIWGVGPNLGITYVGAGIESIMRSVLFTIDGALDDEMGCLRILAFRQVQLPVDGVPGVTQSVPVTSHLNYWFDTGRWSVDNFDATFAGTHYSNLYHQGEYYKATSVGVLKRADGRFFDGDEDPVAGDAPYLAKIQTGRYRFDSLASFKRVWRALAMVKVQNSDVIGAIEDNAEELIPGLGLRLTVETIGGQDGTTVREFSEEELGGGDPKTLRMHLAFQKGQTYRLTIEETVVLETRLATSGPRGYAFLGFGLELGMKRGAAKQPVGRTL